MDNTVHTVINIGEAAFSYCLLDTGASVSLGEDVDDPQSIQSRWEVLQQLIKDEGYEFVGVYGEGWDGDTMYGKTEEKDRSQLRANRVFARLNVEGEGIVIRKPKGSIGIAECIRVVEQLYGYGYMNHLSHSKSLYSVEQYGESKGVLVLRYQ